MIHGLGGSIEHSCPGGENGDSRILRRAAQPGCNYSHWQSLKNDPGFVLTPRKETFLPIAQGSPEGHTVSLPPTLTGHWLSRTPQVSEMRGWSLGTRLIPRDCGQPGLLKRAIRKWALCRNAAPRGSEEGKVGEINSSGLTRWPLVLRDCQGGKSTWQLDGWTWSWDCKRSAGAEARDTRSHPERLCWEQLVSPGSGPRMWPS